RLNAQKFQTAQPQILRINQPFLYPGFGRGELIARHTRPAQRFFEQSALLAPERTLVHAAMEFVRDAFVMGAETGPIIVHALEAFSRFRHVDPELSVPAQPILSIEPLHGGKSVAPPERGLLH